MNSENSKTSEPYRLLLNLADKINLQRSDKYVVLSSLIMHYSWENIKKVNKNNKFKISPPTWNGKFDLPDEFYSISDIQNNFEYIFIKHGEKTDNLSIRTYINKIENRITLKIKRGYYLGHF